MSVAVIGAGASGIMASIKAAEKESVILIDGNDRIAKKIMVSGNGKCNYWNEDIDITKYNSSNKDILENILTYKDKVLDELNNIGLVPTIKNGYYYPRSETSSSVRALFEYQITQKNIETKYNFKVESIYKENNKFVITSNSGEKVIADKVILTTGSKASPKTGSDGSGYAIAESFGHTIKPVLPSLTPLIIFTNKKLKWAGVRTQASISLFIDNKFIKSEEGEIQLTEYGVSGICVFNLSGLASRALYEEKSVKIRINFLPEIENIESYLRNRFHKFSNFTIERVLESLLHYEIIFLILDKLNIHLDTLCKDISDDKIKMLADTIKNLEFNIIDTKDYDRAQVCTGGILLSEINPDTMESKIIHNFYLAGEILDVDGICGGYNLAFAFTSGYLAGKGCQDDSH